MKKLIAMMLVLTMAFALIGCEAQPAPDAPDAGRVYKVAMICDSSINDGGWGAACYNAMVDAAGKKGWPVCGFFSVSRALMSVFLGIPAASCPASPS